jgi:hypothetical protein
MISFDGLSMFYSSNGSSVVFSDRSFCQALLAQGTFAANPTRTTICLKTMRPSPCEYIAYRKISEVDRRNRCKHPALGHSKSRLVGNCLLCFGWRGDVRRRRSGGQGSGRVAPRWHCSSLCRPESRPSLPVPVFSGCLRRTDQGR